MIKLKPGINDLETISPEIAKEWHPTKNGDLKPSDMHNASSRNVWWKCPNGHDYQKTIDKRTLRGQKCPICRRIEHSLASVHPETLEYWDFEKNGSLDPNEIAFGSEKKVWWKCPNGHSYLQRVQSKSAGAGCPICSHQKVSEETCLASVNPKLAKE